MKWSAAILAISLPLSASCQEPDAEAEAKLAANGLVILDYPLKQGFSAYVNARHAHFITSDSLLMAYHRLFEEFASRRAVDEMAALLRFWPEFWKAIPAKASGTEPEEIEGHRRARLLVATAYQLLVGNPPEGLSEEEQAVVSFEVARVEKGEESLQPPWLQAKKGLPLRASYQSFLPTSSANGDKMFERYYRCRKWLQEMKLDAGDQAIRSMLAQLVIATKDLDPAIVGPVAKPAFRQESSTSLLCQLENLLTTGDSDEKADPRKQLGNELWTFLPTLVPIGSDAARGLLGAGDPSRLPETVGAAAGNPIASLLINGSEKALIPKVSTREDDSFYFRVLTELNEEPDPRAPALLRSDAWKRKQLNATLGSWTEYRYALQLASREDTALAGSERLETGFVEPVPGFYHALGEQVEQLRTELFEAGSVRESASNRLAIHLQKLAKLMGEGNGTPQEISRHWDEVRYHVLPNVDLLGRLFPNPLGKDEPMEYWHWDSPEICRKVPLLIQPLVAGYWAGDPAAVAKLREEAWNQKDKLENSLGTLASICFRLEAIAERQLSGQVQSLEDQDFIRGYGLLLSQVMFYEGNSYLSPKDDAPRIVRYATLYDSSSSRVYQAATARPKLMLIRYPDREGKKILCQGAAYAFRQVTADHSLTLAEWGQESETQPWPMWMESITGKPKPEKGKK